MPERRSHASRIGRRLLPDRGTTVAAGGPLAVSLPATPDHARIIVNQVRCREHTHHCHGRSASRHEASTGGPIHGRDPRETRDFPAWSRDPRSSAWPVDSSSPRARCGAPTTRCSSRTRRPSGPIGWQRSLGPSPSRQHPGGQRPDLRTGRPHHLLRAERTSGLADESRRYGVETLAETWSGKRLNSPNDIVCRSDGIAYFTDPPYGVKPAERELHFQGVYSLDLRPGRSGWGEPDAAAPAGRLREAQRPGFLARRADALHLRHGPLSRPGVRRRAGRHPPGRLGTPLRPDGPRQRRAAPTASRSIATDGSMRPLPRASGFTSPTAGCSASSPCPRARRTWPGAIATPAAWP